MMGRLAQRFAMAMERPLLAYGAAIAAVAAAAILRLGVSAVSTEPPSYMTFYPAVLFATLVAGARGGLMATGLSALIVVVAWVGLTQPLQVSMFVVTASATVFIGRAIRNAVLRGVAAEQRFALFQQQALDGFMVLQPIRTEGQITDFLWTYANPAADRVAPAATATVAGRRVLEVFPDETGAAMVARLATAFAADGPDDVEVRRVIDGQERFLRSSALRTGGEVMVTFRDITAQRTSENALRAGETQIRALVDSLPQLIWSCRADGHCDYLSPQWQAFTRVAPEDHHARGWLEAVHPEDRDAAAQAWDQAVSGGLPYDIEYRLRRHDGVWRWFSARASAVRNEAGGIHRWFGASSDITEIVEARAELEARVAERTRELELSLAEHAETEAALAQAQRLETVGRLTGGVAHDFNNLLTVVIGGLDMILQRPGDTARVSRLAEAALAAGQRGEQLTRQLLAFSRRQELTLEVVDVAALIEQIDPLIRRAVGEAVQLNLRLEKGVGASRLDAAQFEAALLNLVVNAADASPAAGGDIEIALERRGLPVAGAAGAMEGDYVVVSVSDNGGGMSPETLQRAFEPFFTTKDVGKGTGLGLAQVYGFAKQVGGVATIASSVGFGTTVSLYLPAVDELPEASPAPATQQAGWARNARVLLVEDDAAVRAVVEGLLLDFGCQVEGAPDAPTALARLLRGERFDVLISDIVMPGGMSGVELAAAARARDADLPILLTSGYAGDRLGQDPESLEWPLLRKPFRAEQLATALREALEQRRVEA